MTVINDHYSALITLLIEVVGEEGDDDELPINEKKKRNIQQPECNYDDFVLPQDLIV